MNEAMKAKKPQKMGVFAKREGKNYLVLSPERIYEAKDTTVALWSLCDGKRDSDMIRSKMIEFLGLDEREITPKLIADAISELEGMGLVKKEKT